MKGTRTEPFFWALFAAGGMVAALFMPIHLLVAGILVPTGAVDAPAHADVHALFSHWMFRVYLVVFIALPLFHWAHRFRAAFKDLGLKILAGPRGFVLYAVAALGAIFAVVTVLQL